MSAKMLFALGGLFFGAMLYAQPRAKISVTPGLDHQFSVAADPPIHHDYGLAYPLTYEFALPAGASDLQALRRYTASAEWSPVAEKTSDDFFNGIEAIRFDYANLRAYLSVAFSSLTDSIYLRIADQAGEHVAAEYLGFSRYYDNRRAAVTVTADDWHQYFDPQFLYALSIFRGYELWVSTAIVTEWCDATTWQHIQTQLDSGYVEAIAHGRNHLHTPYPDPAYEVTGAKTDIIDNLFLPASFRNGEREYVYVWVAPYGEYDDQIDALVSANQYLVSRVVYFGENGFAAWQGANEKYAPVGVTREMGPLWGGSNNLIDLNNAFNIAVAGGGVYHVMCHPHVLYEGEWDKPYTREHLKHISKRKNIWYASMGQLYLYHFLQDETALPVSVADMTNPLPASFVLRQNFPNPFNPATTVSYHLPQAAHVRLSIHNVLGQLVETLVDAKQEPGDHAVQWQAYGQPSGAYFYQLHVDEVVRQGKMLLVR